MIDTIQYEGPGVLRRTQTAAATLFVACGLLLGLGAQAAKAASPNPLTVTVTKLTVQNGNLVASGLATLADSAGNVLDTDLFSVIATVTATPSANASCPILNLELPPITLNLLGLVVQTSSICLDITAHRGGGLLGSLLCSVSNLLENGLNLNQILQGLGRNQAASLLSGLTQVLNSALAAVTNASAIVTPATVDGCTVPNLALGPVDLNLLGLQVHLYNCDQPNQPIIVTITAVPGALLGDLLCSLTSDQLGQLTGTLQNILNALLGILAGL